MTFGGKRASVKNPLITYATEIGGTYISQDDALPQRRRDRIYS